MFQIEAIIANRGTNYFRACMRQSRFRQANPIVIDDSPNRGDLQSLRETVYIVEGERPDERTVSPRFSVRQTFVTLGPARGDQIAILKGVKEGERVVTSGQLKLKSGNPIVINNQVQPATMPILSLRNRNGETTIMKFNRHLHKNARCSPRSLSLLILVLGLRSINLLPVREYPKTQNAVVNVTTVYTGGPIRKLVSGFITTPLENSIAQANGIDYLTSSSSQSVAPITANMRLNYDANVALAEINTKVNAVLNQLPKESQQPVISISTGEGHRFHDYRFLTAKICPRITSRTI